MLALAAHLALALQTPAPGDLQVGDGAAGREAMVQANIAIDRIGHCADELPVRNDLEETYQHLYHRFVTASEEAEELYPGAAPGSETVVRTMDTAPRCDDASLDAHVAEAQRQLQTVEALLRADTAPRSRGLWLGPLRLCGDRVEAIEAAEPEFEGAPPRVNIGFPAAFASRVHALTATRVGRRLSVVLDGATLARPVVNEPVSRAVSVTLPDGMSVEQFRRAASAPC